MVVINDILPEIENINPKFIWTTKDPDSQSNPEHIDKCNTIENTEINPGVCSQLIFNKYAKNIH